MSSPSDPTAASAESEFVITRTFEAPIGLVWKAWTDPVSMEQWFGPKGMPIRVAQLDLRTGGEFRYAMQMPDGSEVWAKFVYREISPPSRLGFVLSFTDPDGTPIRHPLGPGFPVEMLNMISLVEEDGRTLVTVRTLPLHASDEEIQTFTEGHGSMRQGWGGTLDQLVEFLAKA